MYKRTKYKVILNAKLVEINLFMLGGLCRPSHTASSGSSRLAYQQLGLEKQGLAVTGTTKEQAIQHYTVDWKTALKDLVFH